MPSPFPRDDSLQPSIPPTPESDITDSPRSPHIVCDTSSHMQSDELPSNLPLKRKAGRKPLYKTAQERRDRNRRAQLAFRARRSDYLGRLEETCRSLEKVVVELQESNRATNDALSRERNKVKYLERILQSSSANFSSPQIPLNFATSFSPTDNNVMSATGQHGVSFPPPIPQLHSLISLEQQISPTSTSSQTMQSQNEMNSLLFPENYLGMLPSSIKIEL